jgi:hypothetical protein
MQSLRQDMGNAGAIGNTGIFGDVVSKWEDRCPSAHLSEQPTAASSDEKSALAPTRSAA